MMSEPCGGILTHNDDYYRVSSRLEDLAGTTCRAQGTTFHKKVQAAR